MPHAKAALLTDIDRALRQLKADGTFDGIVARWSGERVILFTQREIWLAAIAAALALTLALSVALLLLSRARRRALDVEIDKRRKVETTLRESEARFRSMADDAPMLVWVTDSLGSCTYLSRRWYDFTGHNPGWRTRLRLVIPRTPGRARSHRAGLAGHGRQPWGCQMGVSTASG